MNSAYTSTASLIPKAAVAQQQTTPSTPMKDYEQAFGKLSSSFGFGSSVVSPPIISSRKSRQPKAKAAVPTTQNRRESTQQSQAAYWASQSHKNFEAAYGTLCSTYGFGGGAPTPQPRKL